MSDQDAIREQLGRDIILTHERLQTAIAARLPHMSTEERERYLALVSPLVGKLEETGKPLRQVLQEAMAELLPVVMQSFVKR
jgi:hypothetical protein